MNAAKKIILLLWLLIAASLGNASASTPGATENRVWQKCFETLETRQAEPLQTLGGHQENGGAGYDYAVDCLLAADAGATFGRAASTDYRATFFAANPELEGQVVVHHAVEQQTLKLYPSQVTEAEIHSLENLRGIPKDINSQVHLSQIRKEWNQFYLANPNATQAQLLQKAAEIDAKFGSQFRPPVGGGQ